MPLYKIKDFNSNYREEAFNGDDIKGMTVYTIKSEKKIGSVRDILVDETGHFRYLVIDTGFWVFGKKVLVPVGRCRIDLDGDRLYVKDLNSQQDAEELPEYEDDMVVDYDYEERVREFYRTPSVESSISVEDSLPVETSVAIEETSTAAIAPPTQTQPSAKSSVAPIISDQETRSYEQEPDLFEIKQSEHQKIQLYEERLIVSKEQHKSGDVFLNKRVLTSTAHTTVPLEKERVVIERKTAENDATATNNRHDFYEGEVAHLEVYEETANVNKQAFVREEVEVKKEIVRDRFEASEEVRQEKLEIDVDGKPEIED